MEDHSWVDFALTFLKVRITHTTFFAFILFAVFFFLNRITVLLERLQHKIEANTPHEDLGTCARWSLATEPILSLLGSLVRFRLKKFGAAQSP